VGALSASFAYGLEPAISEAISLRSSASVAVENHILFFFLPSMLDQMID
jgi:hypothetical protein